MPLLVLHAQVLKCRAGPLCQIRGVSVHVELDVDLGEVEITQSHVVQVAVLLAVLARGLEMVNRLAVFAT